MSLRTEALSSAYQGLIELEHAKLEKCDYDFLNSASFLSLDEIKGICKDNTQTVIDERLVVQYSERAYRTTHIDLIYRVLQIRNLEHQRPIPLEFKIKIKKELVPDYDRYKIDDVMSDLLQNRDEAKLISTVVSESLKQVYRSLSSYQYPIIKQLLSKTYKDVSLVAPTASGKTLSFFMPVFIESVRRAIQGRGGTSSVLIYPRRALARDQFRNFLKILHKANEQLIKSGKNLVTIGIDDGDTQRQAKVKDGDSFRKIACVKCEGDLVVRMIQEKQLVACSKCGEQFPYILPTKEAVWEGKPSILVTNIWIVYRRLMTSRIQEIFKELDYVVLDEAHVYSHFLGGHASFILKMLRYVASHGDGPTFVFSSATVPNPRQFLSSLAGVDEDELFYMDYRETLEKAGAKPNRMLLYLYLLPHPASDIETLSEALILALTLWCHKYKMKAITFIDSIAEISTMRDYIHTTILGAREGAEVTDHLFKTEKSPDNDYCWITLTPKEADSDFERFKQFVATDYKRSINMHYGGLNLGTRVRIESDFVQGNVRLLLSTSTLELGIDLSDVGVVMQHKLPMTPEGVVQRIGRAGRNPSCYRTALGIVVLPSLPLSTLYMFNDRLRETLEDVSVLPPLQVGQSSESLTLQYTLSLILLKRALDNKPTYIEWSENLKTREDLIKVLGELLTDFDGLSDFNDKVKLLTKDQLDKAVQEFKQMLLPLFDGLGKIANKDLNNQSEEITRIQSDTESYLKFASETEDAVNELCSAVKDIDEFSPEIKSKLQESQEIIKQAVPILTELRNSVKASVEMRDQRALDSWRSKHLAVFERITKDLPTSDDILNIGRELYIKAGNFRQFRTKYKVDFNDILKMLTEVAENIGTGDDKGVLFFFRQITSNTEQLRRIDFQQVSAFDAYERFRNEISVSQSPWTKLDIFETLSLLLEGKAHFSLLLQTPSPDLELVGVEEA